MKNFKSKAKNLISKYKWIRLAMLLILVLATSILVVTMRPKKAEAPQSKDVGTQVPVATQAVAQPSSAPTLDIVTATSQYVLINKTHPLAPTDYKPTDLVGSVVPTVSSDSAEEKSVRDLIRPDLVKMFADAKLANLDLIMNSGFRSSKLQAFYYNNYVKNSGEASANKFSAKPGYSEHQSGLALDISYANRKCYLDVCFAQTDAGKWLAQHAHEYGFILRYPDGKESITGYQFEPWHFRYVGKDVARTVFDKQTTYEEYLSSIGILK